MKVSVLISTYNAVQDLQLFLPSLSNANTGGYDIEFIVRDDCSSDQTCAFIEKNFPEAQLIRGEENLGFVKSNNIAFSHATGDVICCLNQDTLLEERFFQEALATLQTWPGCVGINTNMIMPWVMSIDEFNSRRLDELPAFEYQLTRYGYTQYVEVEKKERTTHFMTGGAFFLKRSALADGENLFDEHIDAYCEDTELSLRVTTGEGKVVFCPKAIVYHNQIAKTVSSFHGLKKLLKITCNRFSLYARTLSPAAFSKKFPFYLVGIIKKMDHLGLPVAGRNVAYLVGICVALLFAMFFPYWFVKSVRSH